MRANNYITFLDRVSLWLQQLLSYLHICSLNKHQHKIAQMGKYTNITMHLWKILYKFSLSRKLITNSSINLNNNWNRCVVLILIVVIMNWWNKIINLSEHSTSITMFNVDKVHRVHSGSISEQIFKTNLIYYKYLFKKYGIWYKFVVSLPQYPYHRISRLVSGSM